MQLSYNVVKKNYKDSSTIYTIANPKILIDNDINEMPDEPENKEINIEDIKITTENIINDANNRAKAIVEKAMIEAQTIKNNAYEEALKRGYEEGIIRGIEQGKNETKTIRDNARRVLEDSHRVSRNNIESQKNEIIELAFAIAEKIIGYKVSYDDTVILNIVEEAIGNVVQKGQMIIRVNTIDYPAVDCKREQLLKLVHEGTIINVLKDDDIKIGGCKIETDVSTVDANIDSQLEKIKEAIFG